jgi:hypothetical protein
MRLRGVCRLRGFFCRIPQVAQTHVLGGAAVLAKSACRLRKLPSNSQSMRRGPVRRTTATSTAYKYPKSGGKKQER